jgi:hypothetical protein
MDPLNSLPPDEQEILRRYRAQKAQATPVDPVPHTTPTPTPSQGTSDSDGPDTPFGPTLTPSLSYGGTSAGRSGQLMKTEGPSTVIRTPPTQPLPLGASLPLPRPVGRIDSIPAERPTQRRATKRDHDALESGTEDNIAENPRGPAIPEAPMNTLGSLLDTLQVLRGRIATPQPRFLVSEAGGGDRVEDLTRLFAGHNALMSHLLIVVDEMAARIKELEERAGRGDVRNVPGVHRRKRLKVERTTSEQRLVDLVKVRTINYVESSYLM